MAGIVGEAANSLKQALKLPSYSSPFELDLNGLLPIIPDHAQYHPLNKFPSLHQDLCLRMSADITYEEATRFILSQLGKAQKEHGYEHWLKPIDIFQRPGDKSHKQITWRIELSHPERTLTTDEANKLLDKISVEAKKQLKAERV